MTGCGAKIKMVFKKGNIPWNKGKKLSIEHKRKIGESEKGEKHHNWRGGKSFEPYGLNFNNKFKRLIRKRDNQVCMLCGIHREKLSYSLSVHHINYNKK